MIRQFVKFSLQQRILTISIGIFLALVGVWAYTQLKVEAYPDVSDTNVVIITQYPGRAAEENVQIIYNRSTSTFHIGN